MSTCESVSLSHPPFSQIPCSNVNHSLPVLPHSEVELDSKLQPLPQFPTSDKEPVSVVCALFICTCW